VRLHRLLSTPVTRHPSFAIVNPSPDRKHRPRRPLRRPSRFRVPAIALILRAVVHSDVRNLRSLARRPSALALRRDRSTRVLHARLSRRLRRRERHRSRTISSVIVSSRSRRHRSSIDAITASSFAIGNDISARLRRRRTHLLRRRARDEIARHAGDAHLEHAFIVLLDAFEAGELEFGQHGEGQCGAKCRQWFWREMRNGREN